MKGTNVSRAVGGTADESYRRVGARWSGALRSGLVAGRAVRLAVAAVATGGLLATYAVNPAVARPDCTVVPGDALSAAELADECNRDIELTGERTPWSTATARKDGTVEVTTTASATRTAVHGGWSSIDTRVETTPGADGRLDVLSPVYATSFAGGPGQPLAVVTRDGHQLVLDAPFTLPAAPQVQGDQVTYPQVVPGADLVVSVNGDGTGLRQVLRVTDPDAGKDPRLARLTFPVTVSDGLTVTEAPRGGFVVTDTLGVQVFVSAPVAMWDSASDEQISASARRATAPAAMSGQERAALGPDPGRFSDTTGIEVSKGREAALGQAAEQRLTAPVMGDTVKVLDSTLTHTPAPQTVNGADGSGTGLAGGTPVTVSFTPDPGLLATASPERPVYIDPAISASLSSWTMAHSGTPDQTTGFLYEGTQGLGVCDVALVPSCLEKATFRLGWQFAGLETIGNLDEAEVTSASFTVWGDHSWDCNPREVQLWSIDPFSEELSWDELRDSFRSHVSSQTVAHNAACSTNLNRWITFDATTSAKALANSGGSVIALGLRSANESDMTLSWKKYRGSDATMTVVYEPVPEPPVDDSLQSRVEHRDDVADALGDGGTVAAAEQPVQGLDPAAPMPGVVPEAVLPEGGTATLPVGAASTQEVGGLPVTVTQTPGRETEAPDSVVVDVSSPTETTDAGFFGVLLDVDPVESGSAATLSSASLAEETGSGGAVRVQVGYEDFPNVAGGDWASRLTVWHLPECYSLTPDLAECRPTPVETSNDVTSKVLTADLELDAPATEPMAATFASTSSKSSSTLTPSATTATATTAAAGGGGTFVVAAATRSAVGNWGATSLAPSSTWQVSPQTGDFAWSYPFSVPPAPGGLGPDLALSYSSGSVDGRTSGSNNQSSWIGDGWDFSSGFLERSYAACADDEGAVGGQDPNNKGWVSGDLCWTTDEQLSLSFSGGSGGLVKDAGASSAAGHDVFRLKSDDGTKVERFTGAGNGVRDGEYWVVTGTDGTKYFFGQEASSQQSAWGVPVYGNHTGEPCHQSAFQDSVCKDGSGTVVNTGWRWNLDRVEDVHGNTMTYAYTPETQWYSRISWTADTKYERGGILTEITYGTRAGDAPASAPAKVTFTSAERCLPTPGFTCSVSDRTVANTSRWPDVPIDMVCESAGCPGIGSPVFFTTKRLTGVETFVKDAAGAAFRKVDSWTLEHTFPNTGDGTDPVLWLNAVTHTGHAASAAALPGGTPGDANADAVPDDRALTLDAVRFDGIQLPNRYLPAGSRQAAMNRWRIGKVVTESGGLIDVTYSASDCTATHPAEHDNHTRCFPAYWTGEGGGDARVEWFNKYVVIETHADGRTDPHDTSAPIVTKYDYDEATAAWAYDTSPLAQDKYRTWGVWRGYGTVDVFSGDTVSNDVTPAEQLHTRYRYFQGLADDVVDKNGTKRTVAPLDGITDYEQYAGMTRTQTVFNGAGSASTDRVSWTLTTPTRTATITEDRRAEPDKVAYRTAVAATETHTPGAGENRDREIVTGTRTEYDEYGLARLVHDDGDASTAADDRCTTITYARSTAKNLLGSIAEQITVAGSCGTAASAGTTIGWTRMAYDGHGYGTAATDKGLVTSTQQLKGFDGAGNPQFVTTTTLTYDAYGRVALATDVLGRQTVTTYNDRDGDLVLDAGEYGVVTETTTIDPDPNGAAPAASRFRTTSTVDPARGVVTAETDPNGRTTRGVYDTLGRLLAVWTPDRAGLTPAVRYSYQVRASAPNYVVTAGLGPDGVTYHRSVALYDGLLRPRQSQTTSVDRTTPGTIVTDQFYDSRGLTDKKNDPWFTTAGLTTEALLIPQGENDPTDMAVPGRTLYTYDGAGRNTAATWQWREGAAAPDSPKKEWVTTTRYGGDRVTVIPPAGGIPSTKITDPRGQTIEARQHLQADAAGQFLVSRYGYDKAGRMTSVTDSDGNTWSYAYDQAGRQICTADPDKGVATTVFDDAGLAVATTDARGTTLWSAQDLAGRPVGLYETTGATQVASCASYSVPATTPARPAGATQRAAWAYDTLPGALGLPVSSSRYQDGKEYRTAVTGYDQSYKPVGQSVTIPAETLGGTAGQSRTFTTGYSYTPGGAPETLTLPAAGTLDSEEVTTYYDQAGMPEWMGSGFGWGAYVADARYTAFGETSLLDLGNTYGSVVTYKYEQATHRLASISLNRERVTGTEVNLQYKYDDAGNVTSIKDDPTAAGTLDDAQCFTYDALRRLTSAWTPQSGSCGADKSTHLLGGPAPYWTDYEFDTVGNRTKQTQHTDLATIQTAYAYGPSVADPDAGAHALTTLTTTRTPVDAGGEGESAIPVTTTADYVYDQVGNLTNRPYTDSAGTELTQLLGWDADGRLAQVDTTGAGVQETPGEPGTSENQLTDGEAAFVYTADGQRLVRTDATSTTVYLPGGQEVTWHTDGPQAGSETAARYYSFAGQTVAVRTDPGLGGVTSLVCDAQGTTVAAVHNTRYTLTRVYQDPYGDDRGQELDLPGDHRFLGKAEDTTGLTSVGARYYDPTMGRFISVDPVMDLSAPQQWAAYTYAENNPITWSDPTGLFSLKGAWNSVKSGASAVGRWAVKNKAEIIGGVIGVAVGVGCGIVTAGVGLAACLVAGGMLASAVTNVIKQSSSGKPFSVGSLAVDVAIGGATSLIGAPGAGAVVGQLVAPIIKRHSANVIIRTATSLAARGSAAVASAKSTVNNLAQAAKDGISQIRNLRANIPRPPAGAAAGGAAGSARSQVDDAVEALTCSFAGTTLVLMAGGTTKAIQDIKPGDEVASTDPETGKTEAKTVEAVHSHDDTMIVLEIDGQTITTTEDHPFWSATDQKFERADQFAPGEKVLTTNGELATVTALRTDLVTYDDAWNLTVTGLHTYHVLTDGDRGPRAEVLVHNCGGTVLGHKPSCDCANGGVPVGPRNAGLANTTHPVTGVPFDAQGFPDFSAWRHPSVPDVRINLTGSRSRDFTLANAAAGLKSTPAGYTWNHHQDCGLMQLVQTGVHMKTGHTGGFSIC